MRAHTSGAKKIGWLAQAAARTGGSLVMPRSAVIYAPPLDEVRFLVDAAGRHVLDAARSHAVLDILAELKARDLASLETDRRRA